MQDYTNNQSSNTIKLSVVIVNFNGERFLFKCLESLINNLKGIQSEIILVDNASADESISLIKKHFPTIKLIQSDINLGFTGGNNLGAQQANGELILLLNNDTECKSSFIPMIKFMDEKPNLGAIGCNLNYANMSLQYSIGFEHTPVRIILSWLGLSRLGKISNLFKRVESKPDLYKITHTQIDWVSGACLLTRAKLWQQLGGLDNQFFMYCEDVDYCHRLITLGYQIGYTPDTQILHFEGSGKSWIGEKALKRTARSYLIYTNKHYGNGLRWLVGISLGLIFLTRSNLYLIRFMFKKSLTLKEKIIAYRNAGFYLICGAANKNILAIKI